MNRKRIVRVKSRSHRLLAASVIAASVLSACGTGGSGNANSNGKAIPFNLVQSGVLTVSPYGASPPAITISSDNKLGGLLGDLINGFAKKYDLQVKVTQTTFASSLLYVKQGRSDMTPFIYHTADRAKSAYYTAGQFKLPVAAITKSTFDYTGLNSLKGKRIAAVLGEVWGPYFQKTFGSENVKMYQKDVDAAQSLLNGQSDAYINSALQLLNPPLRGHKDVVAHRLKAGDAGMPADIINNVAYNIVSCNNKGLAKAYDKYLAGLATSGKLEKLYKKDGFPKLFRISKPSAPSQGC